MTGMSTIAGSNNWIQSGATGVPSTLTGTVTGSSPGFTDAAANDFRVAMGSPLVDAGASSLAGPAGHEFPNPLPAPLYLPPTRAALALGTAEGRNTVGAIDIGAFELGGGGKPPEPVDGGAGTNDAGGTSGDGGPDSAADGGCSCSIAHGPSQVPAIALLCFLAFALRLRRRAR